MSIIQCLDHTRLRDQRIARLVPNLGDVRLVGLLGPVFGIYLRTTVNDNWKMLSMIGCDKNGTVM